MKTLCTLFVAVLVSFSTISHAAEINIPIEVVDGAGKPISGAELLQRGDLATGKWTPIKEGRISITQPPQKNPRGDKVFVRAPGFLIAPLEVPEGAATQKVVLETGRSVLLQVKQGDRDVNVTPLVATPETLASAISWMDKMMASIAKTQNLPPSSGPILYPPEKIDGKLAYRLPKQSTALYFVVDEPGVLRGHVSGPHEIPAEATSFAIKLPEPAKLDLVFKPTDLKEGERPQITLMAIIFIKQTNGQQMGYGTRLVQEIGEQQEMKLSFNDLSPGRYQLDALATKAGQGLFGGGSKYDHKDLTLKEGPNAEIKLADVSVRNRLKGDRQLDVVVKNLKGEPARGVAYKLQYDQEYPPLVLAEGTLDDSGKTTLKNLAAGPEPRMLSFVINSESLSLDLVETAGKKEIEFQLPPTVGDAMPDLVLKEAFTGKTTKLSELKGKVLFLDFWATWCGPCQQPMEENNQTWTRRKKDWEGKAEIVAISIDDRLDTLKSHVDKKNWKEVTHLWAEEGGPGWKSQAAQAYAIRGVPTCILVDASGKIVWRGHPASMSLEKEIDKLLSSK